MIHFVTYHVDLKKSTGQGPEYTKADIGTKMRAYFSYLSSHVDYRVMMDILFASINHYHPRVKKTILTDEKTEFSLADPEVQVIRGAIDSRQIILSRTKLQLAFLEAQTSDDHIAFVDTDMIINQPLDPVFARDFDLGLTYRPSADMPINGGVMFIHGKHRARAIRFFRTFLEVFETTYADQSVWWGDQSALRDCCAFDANALPTEDTVKEVADGTKILLLPCERYNFRPRNHFDLLHTQKRVILHFVSTSKRFMPFYWRLHRSTLGRRLVKAL